MAQTTKRRVCFTAQERQTMREAVAQAQAYLARCEAALTPGRHKEHLGSLIFQASFAMVPGIDALNDAARRARRAQLEAQA